MANDPINKYDVAGLLTDEDLYAFGEIFYEPGDTGHTLAMRMMARLGLGAYKDPWNNLYDASVSGSAGLAMFAGSGVIHVGFYIGTNTNGRYQILGGNQGKTGEVKISNWTTGYIKAIIWPRSSLYLL